MFHIKFVHRRYKTKQMPHHNHYRQQGTNKAQPEKEHEVTHTIPRQEKDYMHLESVIRVQTGAVKFCTISIFISNSNLSSRENPTRLEGRVIRLKVVRSTLAASVKSEGFPCSYS